MDKNIEFEAVIGLEVHVRLGLNTKLFCADENAYGREPNQLISEVSLGYPGTLPVLNKEAIRFAVRMGMACHSTLATEIVFDRKNYLYPDLPKGYQITQERQPICSGGYIEIFSDKKSTRVNLTRIHLEEDAGKSIHRDGYSAIDYNRAGTALIEIVTEPELQTPEQAYAFLYEVRRMVRYLEIGDGNMEEGSLRCDANISIKPVGSKKPGNKVEIKNMNSFTNVKKAIIHELKRQNEMVQQGKRIISETRSYNPADGTTSSMREKETLADYRYFPEPDLVPEILSKSWLQEIRENLPELGAAKEQKYKDVYQLSGYEAALLTKEKENAEYFELVIDECCRPKLAANWMMGPILTFLNEHDGNLNKYPLTPRQTASILSLIDAGKISFSFASKYIHPEWLASPDAQLEDFINQTMEENELVKMVEEVIIEHEKEVQLYRNGKTKLFGSLMGSLMRKTESGTDPKKMSDLLQKALERE